MGSPLVPTLAIFGAHLDNRVIAHLENQVMAQ